MSIDFHFAWQTLIDGWPLFGYGIAMTLTFAIVGTVAGLIIGLLLGAIRSLEIDPLDSSSIKALKKFGRGLTSFYVWIFRGTPMMVQAVFLYYLLKPIFHWDGLTAGLIIISINTAAYMAEIIRSGIQAIDRGPQAIKNSFPSIGNQLIVNIKDSCMLNAIAVTELYFQATSIAGSTMKYTEIYMLVAIMYLALTTIATFVLNTIEKKLNKTNKATTMDACA
ncbi:amino acid ABC transporter permease [uncultured Sharpea sp.]|uniref:amino acid ABC transporter permease n=1 Tax=uncultured Sharpea sp. TaxID=1112738 RepID=UPI002583E68A|nr:amino acid ABC transporter permease [uncultured Sharpea sp.]